MPSKNKGAKYTYWRVGQEFDERLTAFRAVLEKRFGIKLRRNQIVNYLIGKQLEVEERAIRQQNGQ